MSINQTTELKDIQETSFSGYINKTLTIDEYYFLILISLFLDQFKLGDVL